MIFKICPDCGLMMMPHYTTSATIYACICGYSESGVKITYTTNASTTAVNPYNIMRGSI